MEDVIVTTWPGPSAPSGAEGSGPARLYLVEPGHEPPPIAHCLEDYVLLPAGDDEIASRLRALRVRCEAHGNGIEAGAPQLDAEGVLHAGGRWIYLPPIEARIMEPLLRRIGHPVATDVLLDRGWGGARTDTGALRIHIMRLRRRILPLGLHILTLPSRGYMLSRTVRPPGSEPIDLVAPATSDD